MGRLAASEGGDWVVAGIPKEPQLCREVYLDLPNIKLHHCIAACYVLTQYMVSYNIDTTLIRGQGINDNNITGKDQRIQNL